MLIQLVLHILKKTVYSVLQVSDFEREKKKKKNHLSSLTQNMVLMLLGAIVLVCRLKEPTERSWAAGKRD
jgi:uncharacterized membrane protein YwzB